MYRSRIDSDQQVDLLGVNLTLDFGQKRKRPPTPTQRPLLVHMFRGCFSCTAAAEGAELRDLQYDSHHQCHRTDSTKSKNSKFLAFRHITVAEV